MIGCSILSFSFLHNPAIIDCTHNSPPPPQKKKKNGDRLWQTYLKCKLLWLAKAIEVQVEKIYTNKAFNANIIFNAKVGT